MSDTPAALAARHRALPRLVIDSSTTYNGSVSLVSSTPYTNSGSVPSGSTAFSMPEEGSYIARSMYDFEGGSAEQLSFHAGEVLEILYSDPSGWSAARREASDAVGWIPSAYVELFAQAPSGENHDQSAPCATCGTAPMSHCGCQPFILSPDSDSEREWIIRRNAFSPSELLSAALPTGKSLTGFFLSPQVGPAPQEPWRSPLVGKLCPPSPVMPPPPTPKTAPLFQTIHFRPVRHSSALRMPKSAVDGPLSLPHTGTSGRRTHRPDKTGSARLSALLETPLPSLRGAENPVDETLTQGVADRHTSVTSGDPSDNDLVEHIGGHSSPTDAQAGNSEKIEAHGSPLGSVLILVSDKEGIGFDEDGTVLSGTLRGLVRYLVVDSKDASSDIHFRHTFFSTLHTFSRPTEIFDLLVEQYHRKPSSTVSSTEMNKWRQQQLLAARKRVLSVFEAWLVNYRMIENDPAVAQRLQEFLAEVSESPESDIENVAAAQDMIHTLKRLTLDVPAPPPVIEHSHKRKNSSRSEIFKMDPITLTENLCLYEHKSYAKVRPQECFQWVRQRNGDTVVNLAAFCSLYDKLAVWVKHSILFTDGLNRRADAVDFWLKVAEKCRAVHNYSSMSAIATALSSTVISRLHLTWAHTAKASHLEPLTRTNDPSGNFSAFRKIQGTLDAPCVPFVGPYLTHIVHLDDRYPDSRMPEGEVTQEPVFSIVKRRKWVAVAEEMLRHQGKAYPFAQDPDVMRHIEANFAFASGVDQAMLSTRSQSLQETERSGSKLRRSLEAAAF